MSRRGRLQTMLIVVGLAGLPGVACSDSPPRDINYGTDAGANFEVPIEEVKPKDAADASDVAAAGAGGGAGSAAAGGSGGTTGAAGAAAGAAGGSAGAAGGSAGAAGSDAAVGDAVSDGDGN